MFLITLYNPKMEVPNNDAPRATNASDLSAGLAICCAAGCDRARQALRGFLGSIKVVAEPTPMLLYSEPGFEAGVTREPGMAEYCW
jgi:hypothetical protein